MKNLEFGFINYIVILFYLIVVILVGIFFTKKSKTLDDFFLGGRKVSWIAVGMSMFASVTSATTIIAVPALIFYQNMNNDLTICSYSNKGKELINVLNLNDEKEIIKIKNLSLQ